MDEEELAQLVKDMASEGRTQTEIDAVVDHVMKNGLKKKESTTIPSASLEESKTHGITGALADVPPVTESQGQNVSPAVANAFDVSRKGKEYQRAVKSAKVNILKKQEEHARKTIAEKQALIKTQEDADRENKLLGEELELIRNNEVEKAQAEIAPKYKEFQEAFNSPFKNKEFAQGFRESYHGGDVSPMEELEKQMPGLNFLPTLGKSLGKGISTAILDQIPGGSASAFAGAMTANFDNYLVSQRSTFNPNDYWNPELAFEKRKKEVVADYIKENGKEKYEEEKAKFETERAEQKKTLTDYAEQQQGESAAKVAGIPEKIGDIKNPTEAIQYAGKNVGQTLGFMAPTIAAGLVNPALGAGVGMGINSAVEKGEAYQEGLNLLEQTGLSKTELFKSDADKLLRESSTRSGLINGMLEYVGAITTVGKFMPKNYVAQTLQKMLKGNVAAGITVGALTEGVTEWAQAKDTHYAAAIGAGANPEQAREYAMHQDDSEDFYAGVTGGLGISGAAHVINPHQGLIDKTAQEIDKTHGKIETPHLDELKLKVPEGDLAHEKPVTQNAEVTGQNIPEVKQEESVQVQGEPQKQEEVNEETIKPEENAVSQRITETLPLDESSRHSEEMGGRISEPEPQKTTGENQQQEGQVEEKEKLSGIKKELVPENVTTDLESKSDKEFFDEGKKAVEEGTIEPETIIHEVNESPRALQPNEVAALVYYKAKIDKQLTELTSQIEGEKDTDKKQSLEHEFNVVSQQIMDYNKMALHTARQQSVAFRLRKMMLDSEYNLHHEIERFKSVNKGAISEDMVNKFIDIDKQLKEANKKILELEAKQTDKNLLQQLQDIAAFEKKKGRQELTAQRKKSITETFDKLKVKITKGTVHASVIPGITLLPHVWNATVETIKQAILTGVDVHTAIQNGIDYLKAQKETFDEKALRDYFIPLIDNIVKTESIHGKLKIPKKLLTSIVESGASDIKELTNRVYNIVKHANPDVTERDVMDAISDYAKKRTVSQDEIIGKLNAMKRIGKIIASIEDLNKGKLPANIKESAPKKSVSKEEQKLRGELKTALRANPEFQQIAADKLKQNVAKSITEYERRIKEKDFVHKKLQVPITDKELEEAYIRKAQARTAYEKAHEENRLANRTLGEIAFDTALDLWQVPNSFRLSFDFSALGTQSFYYVTRPAVFFASVRNMMQQTFSQKKHEAFLTKIEHENPKLWDIMTKSKLAITTQSGKLSARNEEFANRMAKLIPWVRVSDRAYSGMLNSIRVGVFLQGINEMEKAGFTFEEFPEEYKRLAEHINTGTGRSNLGVNGENASRFLRTFLLTPRFVYSRFKVAIANNRFILDPTTYTNTARGKVNRMILTDQAKFIGFLGMMLYLLGKKKDWEVEWNPLSSKFGQMRLGNYFYDPTGKVGAMMSLAWRFTMGKYKNSQGRIDDINQWQLMVAGKQYTDKEGQEYNSTSFLRSKLNIASGEVINFWQGHDIAGNKMNASTVFKVPTTTIEAVQNPLINMIIPLSISEVLQNANVVDKANKLTEEKQAYGLETKPKRSYTEIVAPTVSNIMGFNASPDRRK